MFPTLSSLVNHLFNTNFSWPLPTFGFFVALAFILSYCTFLSEFKRKEREGFIKPFVEIEIVGQPPTLMECLVSGFPGFIIGFKVVGAFIDEKDFVKNPLEFIFSDRGSWVAGFIFYLIFVLAIYFQRKSEQLAEGHATDITVHPYELMPKLILWAAFWGFIGAKLFNFFENFSRYRFYSFDEFLKYSGLTFLGGLVFGALTYLYIGHKRGMKLIHLADIGSPGMLVAYGIGRIGCHLSGDGDWGIVNNSPKPLDWLPDWMWSFRFPHNILGAGAYISGCTQRYCFILPQGVFPTSLYETFIILSAFFVLWFNRKHIKTPGLMFVIYLLIMGSERFLIEKIRVNYKYDLLGLSLSEAQIISLLFMAGGVIGLVLLLSKKMKYDSSVDKKW